MKKNIKYTDKEYLEGIKNHNKKVIKSIYLNFLPKITYYLIKNSGTQLDAEDIFANALEVIYRKSSEEKFHLSSSFYTFLFSICQRQWLKKLRRKKFGSKQNPEDLRLVSAEESIDVILEKMERLSLYREKFQELGKKCQKLLTLSLVDELPMVEIAKIIGSKSSGAVRKMKFSCKNQLIQLIQLDQRYKELIA